MDNITRNLPGSKNLMTEKNMHIVCRGESKGIGQWKYLRAGIYNPKCHFIHHINPYLKVGPFSLEMHFYIPFRGIFHDFFSEKEMQWTIKSSLLELSASKSHKNESKSFFIHKPRTSLHKNLKKPKIYEKAAITTLLDIAYSEEQIFYQISNENEPLVYGFKPLVDPYKFSKTNNILFQISKRVELATHLNVTQRYSSKPYQTTCYGLAGIIEQHTDPLGYEKGAKIGANEKYLTQSGDMFATFMGWMADTELGGATAFTEKGFENAFLPKKGSAAFWINLLSCHSSEHRSIHAGCPVLKGSKWILNKWIMSYNQWKRVPCDLQPHMPISVFAEPFHF